MKLKKISLANNKLFGDTTLQIAPTSFKDGNITIFTGSMASGKSTVINSIAAAISKIKLDIHSQEDAPAPIDSKDAINALKELSQRSQGQYGTIEVVLEANGKRLARNIDVAKALSDDIELESLPAWLNQDMLPGLRFYPSSRVFKCQGEMISLYNDGSLLSEQTIKPAYLPFINSVLADATPFDELSIADGKLQIKNTHSQWVPLSTLSGGEMALAGLFIDIACYLVSKNPSDPKECHSVVIIDEPEAHIHPYYLHDLTDKFASAFINCQFILTSNAPQILASRNDMILWNIQDAEIISLPDIYGEDVNSVLNITLDIPSRSRDIEERFNEINDFIELERFDEARQLLDEIKDILPSDNKGVRRSELLLAGAKVRKAQSKPKGNVY